MLILLRSYVAKQKDRLVIGARDTLTDAFTLTFGILLGKTCDGDKLNVHVSSDILFKDIPAFDNAVPPEKTS